MFRLAGAPVGDPADLRLAAAPPGAPGRRPLAGLLSALANEIRLEVLTTLTAPKHVGQIAAELELDQATVSHALGRLRAADLVTCDIDGRMRIYRLKTPVQIVATSGKIELRISIAGATLTVESPAT